MERTAALTGRISFFATVVCAGRSRHNQIGSEPDRPLTADDLEFLRRPLYGFLTVAEGPRPPQPRPVWFEVTTENTL